MNGPQMRVVTDELVRLIIGRRVPSDVSMWVNTIQFTATRNLIDIDDHNTAVLARTCADMAEWWINDGKLQARFAQKALLSITRHMVAAGLREATK